jgi:uncharacterized protein YqcC (DUF446 family)
VPGPFYFAWAGGVITDQVTLITNGTTHGALKKTVALAADTLGQQLRNIANTGGLEEGAFYQISGPGLASGTTFVFDNSTLSGLPTSINLSAAISAAEKSATFIATQAVPVGTALGTLTAGQNTVSFSGLPLAAGRYGIFGTGIGETLTPVNTVEGQTTTGSAGITVVGSCYVDYDGTSSGTLKILVASSHTTRGFDEFGQETNIVTWTVTEQAVNALATGTFPLALSGFPSDDPASITGLPSGWLAGLSGGAQYNIAGNGIPIGATFVAPSSGTTLTLSLDATASDLNAILTITGPRTPDAPFDAAVHNRFDEEVIGFDIDQEEGGFATLTIDIKNPNIGLLALGRNLWCWLSWDQAWPAGAPDLVALFNGRLIGVPKLQAGEVVQLQFLARPDDLLAQKEALASSLAVLPYFDHVWYPLEVSDDQVLEAYSALWHIDRTTLELTTSDILAGEDGTIDIGEGQAIYEAFTLAYGEPPLTAVTISGTVGWQQQATGILDITDALAAAFHDQGGSAYTRSFPKTYWNAGGGALIQVLNGDGLKADWPKPGTNIGGGWSLSSQNDVTGLPLCYIRDASITAQGGWLQSAVYRVSYSAQAPQPPDINVNVGLVTANYGNYFVDFPLTAYKVRMSLEYRANRKRTETITAVLTAGVQRELSDPAESDRETITLTSQFVDQGVDPDGTLPIGNVSYRSYFQTDRGTASFEYLLLAARAKIRARARAVDITFRVGWADAVPITLRHSVQYTDRRVPGGVAIGKVKSYKLSVRDGTMVGEFTIGCSIGTAEIIAPAVGVPTYADAGYVDSGWQAMSGQQSALIDEELAYETLEDFAIADDGLDLTNLTVGQALNEVVVTNGLKIQLPILNRYQAAVGVLQGDPVSIMKTLNTTVTIDLKPVAGAEFTTAFFPAVSRLTLPKTIDLSGTS